MHRPFRNEPLTDFSIRENREAFEGALARVEHQLGRTWPLRIGGVEIDTEQKITSVNPSRPAQVIGHVGKASAAQAEQAIAAAKEAFKTWSHTPAQARARILWRAAAIMRRRKHELSAWMVKEVAKTWVEADADTAEAIDFLDFYGREACRLAEKQPLAEHPSEDNNLYYIPLGVGAVIPPWNFPCAIMAGMTTAAAVAGNTVVLKPASTAPVIAAVFCEILQEAGMPAGVVNFCPGSGSEIGDLIVDHKDTRFVAFTGSKEVGLRINSRAAQVSAGQIWIKRAVLEMGGKDAIVADADADPEEVATGIVAGAFGFQGQKCSACSRAILHEAIYETVLEKVIAKTQALKIGFPEIADTQVAAVIDKAQYNKVLEYIEIGKTEGELVAGGAPAEGLGDGYFIQPTVFSGIQRGSRLATEEIFGPVLAIEKAESFEAAIDSANDTEFGLTGAVYSNTRAHLEYARQHYHAGNLYLNRKCTGALVAVHPFGGFNMSGTDSKAGGRDYLLLFTQAKLVSERM